MSISEFLKSKIEYRALTSVGQSGDYIPEYETYTLDGVMVREVFVSGGAGLGSSVVTVYCFPSKSTCTNADGEEVSLPKSSVGDLCVIRPGEPDEVVLRVAEAGYYIDSREGGCLGHVRLKLR